MNIGDPVAFLHPSRKPFICSMTKHVVTCAKQILQVTCMTFFLNGFGMIFRKHGLSFHCYADETQVYLPVKRNSVGFESLMACLADVKAWLSLHFLIFNEKKTEIIVFCPSEFLDSPNLDLSEMSLCLKSWVKNLGFIFDDVLKFDRQINSVVKACFFQLRLLSKAKPFLSFKDFENVIHAFILSRLDYSNSHYFGIRQTAISRLQLVQNAAARLLSGVKKREHITHILRSLHWLPVCFRLDFKMLLLVYKSINGLAPTYLCELLTEYQLIRSLQSSTQDLFSTPKSRLECRGDRAFCIAAPGFGTPCHSPLDKLLLLIFLSPG